ncbi:MAG: sulfatase-like hydrolase/transferase [Rubripirellula sp.]|nr:sulfatase-like hydrolase/transferase [Rubripirellula sp.]
MPIESCLRCLDTADRRISTNAGAKAVVRSFAYSALALTVAGLVCMAPAKAAPPNILIVLADDMGYGDLGCTGSKLLKTDRIDELARSGVLCKQAYVASSVCSPSRAGLITGRDPRRFGYQGNLNMAGPNYATRLDLLGLPPGEHTLGDHLGAAGYSTALIGKWHLGTGDGFHPQQRGFQYFCGMLGGGHSYFPKPENNKLERNGVPLKDFPSPYLTDFFTDEALEWIGGQESANDDKPWFLFLSYNAPHGPLQATEKDLEACSHIKDKKRRIYAAMMLALDRGVGRVLDQLDAFGERDNTLVCFFSDNGGATGNASWNGELSGAKGTLREGGVRIPMIWSWPARIPNTQVHEGVVSSLDLLPTFMAAAGGTPLPLGPPRAHEDKNNRKRSVTLYGEYDGKDLLPQLTVNSGPLRRTLFWRLQGQTAILDGPDKLITLSHRAPQVFRPAEDAGEQEDRFASDPTRADELFQLLGKWEASLATVPLWGSSPYWESQSAKQYDNYPPRQEPE